MAFSASPVVGSAVGPAGVAQPALSTGSSGS